MSSLINLEFIAAKFAPKIIAVEDQDEKKKRETYLNQALGILAEQGPFALLLWAKSGKKEIQKNILKQMPEMIKTIGLPDLTTSQNLLKDFSENITQNFLSLMLCRQVFDRVLIYARYYAKADS